MRPAGVETFTARRPAALRMLRPLEIRPFRLLWTGMTVSLFGDGVFLVALAWQVYQLSNVPTALTAVGLAMSAPHVALLLVGGLASDRFERRRVMIGADAVRGLAVGAMGLLSMAGVLRPWHVLALIVPYGAANAFFGPAFDAIVPEIVPSGSLAEANALDQLVRPMALRLAGPAVGGWLIAATGSGSALLLDAATFAVSAACLAAMGLPSRGGRHRRRRPGRSPGRAPARRGRAPAPSAAGATPTGGPGRPSALREVVEGFRFVRLHVWLWGTFAAATVAYLLFMGPTEALLPYVVKNDLGGGAGVLGWVFAAGGLGAVAGAVATGQRGMPRRHLTFMFTTWAAATLAVAGYGLARWSWQVMAVSFAFNALETAGTVVWGTTKHRLVPTELLGRVSSFDWFVSIGLVPLSFALCGPAAALLGARTTLVLAGVLGAVVTMAALFLPGMRDAERGPQTPAVAQLEPVLAPAAGAPPSRELVSAPG